MTIPDVPKLVKLDHIAFPQPTSQWSSSPFIQYGCIIHKDTSFLAVDGDEVVGFVTSGIFPGNLERAEGVKIAVHPDYQGTGLATRLMSATRQALKLAGVKYVQITVRPELEKQRRIYQSWGYAEKEFLQDLYCPGESAILMESDISRY